MAIRTREQLESDMRASGADEVKLYQLDNTTRIFLNLEVNSGTEQTMTTTPTKLNIFKATAETPDPTSLMRGGSAEGYASEIYIPVDCYVQVCVTLSFIQASGVSRQFYYDLYKNGSLLTRGGAPVVLTGQETVAPIITIDRYARGDVLAIYGSTDSGTFDVTFSAGHFTALRVR